MLSVPTFWKGCACPSKKVLRMSEQVAFIGSAFGCGYTFETGSFLFGHREGGREVLRTAAFEAWEGGSPDLKGPGHT